MTFEDLQFEDTDMGIGAHHLFDNHYGVSVIQGRYTHGGRDGLYELAVIRMTPDMKYSELCYDTHITNDVIGYLTPDKVTDIMKQVSELK